MRRRLPFVLVVLLAMGLTGCSTRVFGDIATGSSSAGLHRVKDWVAVRGADLNCPDGQPAALTWSPLFHDLNNKGEEEAIVAMHCRINGQRTPDQLEVFDGDSPDLNAPVRLVRVWSRDKNLFISDTCVFFSTDHMVVWTQAEQWERRWDGKAFVPVGDRIIKPTTCK
jgi:hypothetical protein